MRTARPLILITLLLIAAAAPAQLRRTTRVYKDFYENGAVKKVTRVKTIQSSRFELYDNYKKTIVRSTEYYPDGTVKQRVKKVTKLGNSGRDCYLILHVIKTYYETGIIKQVDIENCDNAKYETRYYDEQGNLTFTRINYHLS
ncbi:MAG: hypothetical protein AB1458_11235 [Bacteroidota bacterium]